MNPDLVSPERSLFSSSRAPNPRDRGKPWLVGRSADGEGKGSLSTAAPDCLQTAYPGLPAPGSLPGTSDPSCPQCSISHTPQAPSGFSRAPLTPGCRIEPHDTETVRAPDAGSTQRWRAFGSSLSLSDPFPGATLRVRLVTHAGPGSKRLGTPQKPCLSLGLSAFPAPPLKPPEACFPPGQMSTGVLPKPESGPPLKRSDTVSTLEER